MTALEARVQTTKAFDKLFGEELNKIRNSIQLSCNQGLSFCNVYTPLNPNIRKVLENEGYEISIPRIAENSKSEYKINW